MRRPDGDRHDLHEQRRTAKTNQERGRAEDKLHKLDRFDGLAIALNDDRELLAMLIRTHRRQLADSGLADPHIAQVAYDLLKPLNAAAERLAETGAEFGLDSEAATVARPFGDASTVAEVLAAADGRLGELEKLIGRITDGK